MNKEELKKNVIAANNQKHNKSLLDILNDDECDRNLDDEVTNYTWRTAQGIKQHSDLLPRDVRMIICVKSGFGKATLLMRLLLEKGMLDYNNLHVCGRSLHQPEYKVLNTGFSNNFSKNQVYHLFKNQE